MSPRPDNFHEVPTGGIDVDIDIGRTLKPTSTSIIEMRSAQAITLRGASLKKAKTRENRGDAVSRRPTSTKKQRQGLWVWSSPLPYLLFGLMSTIYLHVIFYHSLSSSDESSNVLNAVPSFSRSKELMNSKHKTELSACLIVMDDNHFLIGE